MRRQCGSLEFRLWRRVDKSGECWEWQGALDSHGYGQIGKGPGAGNILTHKAAWILTRGSIPEGLHVLHECDNRKCVRPEHLFLGTHRDNMKDMARKLRNTVTRLFTHDNIATIRRLSADGMNNRVLGRLFRVSNQSICQIVNRRAYGHVS